MGMTKATICIGTEKYIAGDKLATIALQKAGYKALVNTMYAFKELPEELLNAGSTLYGGMLELTMIK